MSLVIFRRVVPAPPVTARIMRIWRGKMWTIMTARVWLRSLYFGLPQFQSKDCVSQ